MGFLDLRFFIVEFIQGLMSRGCGVRTKKSLLLNYGGPVER